MFLSLSTVKQGDMLGKDSLYLEVAVTRSARSKVKSRCLMTAFQLKPPLIHYFFATTIGLKLAF